MSEKKNRNDESKEDKLDRESSDCECSKESSEESKESSEESKESSEESCKESSEERCKESYEGYLFRELNEFIGEELLVVTETAQLNLLGQTFRPIFVGPLVEVEGGHITLFPVTIKILNAPFFKFPTPLSIPLEKIAHFTPDFDSDTRFPLI